MKRNLRTPLLAAGLLLALAAGCGSGDKAPNTAATQAESEAAQTMVSESAAPETAAPEGTVTESTAPESEVLETEPVTAESTSLEGITDEAFHLDLLSEKSVGDYEPSRVKEIILEPEGSSFVFWTTETLTDLRLMGVSYDGDQFMENQVYLSCDEFTAQDAILLTHMYMGAMPDLKLTFYDGEGTLHTLYITESGKDASPVMISEEDLLFRN